MKKILLFFLLVSAGSIWGQNHPIEYYFSVGVSTKDSLIMYAKELLELSGHTYHYVGEAEGNWGSGLGSTFLMFEREEKYWDGSTLKGYVKYGGYRLPDRVENGIAFLDDIPPEQQKARYGLSACHGEFEDMYTIWSKYIDPENADREQLRSNGYVKGPGRRKLNWPGIYKVREGASGEGVWTYKFAISGWRTLDVSYHSINAWSGNSLD